jgi:anti-sigma regulatory factor (Ser/Thr protein kinase)
LRQILLNLLSNAVKFTSRGDIGLSLTADRCDDRTARFKFTVWDNGIGIPPDRLPALFAPFTQADNSTTRRFGGSGLGLSIAKQLAEAMGGSIEVESTLAVGTTFRVAVRLPCIDAPSLQPAVLAASGLEILLAVRHTAIRSVIARQLQAAGYRPLLADTAQQAIEHYRNQLRESRPLLLSIIDHQFATARIDLARHVFPIGRETRSHTIRPRAQQAGEIERVTPFPRRARAGRRGTGPRI